MISARRNRIPVDGHAKISREAGDGRDLGKRKLRTDMRSGLDLQRDEIRIGGDQPVLTVQPPADRAAIRGRGRHSRLPKSSVPRDSRDRAEATR